MRLIKQNKVAKHSKPQGLATLKSGVVLMAHGRIDFTKINILPGALFGPIGHFECVLFWQKEPHDSAHSAKLSRGTTHDKEVFFCEAREAFLTPSPGPYPLILQLAEPRWATLGHDVRR